MNLSPGKRRALWAALVLVALVAIAGFLVLPPIVKAQAARRASDELGRTVTIGNVRMNPFALSITLEDVNVKEKDSPASFLGWTRLYVRFDALASLAGDWVLGEIELSGFHAAVVVNPNGSFNFSDLLLIYAPPSKEAAKPGRPIRIGELSVDGAQVNFNDRSLKHPFATVVGPLTFKLSGFRTSGSRGAPYHFDAMTEAGERLSWSGTLSADPVASRGEFDIENLILKKYTPYFEALTRADLTGGTLSLRGSYEADFDPASRVLQLHDTEVHLRDLSVVERSGGGPLAGLSALDVTGLQADAVAMKASVGRIAVKGGNLVVRRAKDGSINLLTAFTPPAKPPAQPGSPPSPPAESPQVSVGEFAVSGSSVAIEDRAAPTPVQLLLGSLEMTVRNVSLADGATMPLHLSFDWAPKGTVAVDGTVGLKPALKADLKANVGALEILPLSPYLEQFVDARIARGSVSANLAATASLSGDALAATVQGDASVDNVGIVDGVRDEDLLGVTRLSLKGIKAETSPRLGVSVAAVDVSGPYARVRVNADKSLNVASFLKSPGGPAVATKAAAPGAAPRIEIGRVSISGGDFSLSDHSVEPNVQVSLGNFSGTISGLSSENLARADVDLKGMVGDAGPVTITGKLDPLGAHKYVGLDINVTNVDLLPVSPYMGKYAGYALARGQLVVASKILVDGDKVDSTNVVTLNQFTFGAATPNPDATALPVRLGVALLKDTDGRIIIDLPVQGSLGNPDFRVGKVVVRVIVNLLTKAAVSPFALVGSMFGGGGEELSYQEFVPGKSDLQASETPKLATLEKALAERPGLSLGIEGGYDAAADSYAVKRSKLESLVRAKIWDEHHAANPNIPPPGELVISPEENAAMVKKLFDAKFPPGTKFGTPLPPEPEVAAPPPGPRPGIIRRIVNVVTFKKQFEHRAEKREEEKLNAQHEGDVEKALAAGLPLEEMTGRLAESMVVTNDDLGALAAARAQNVRKHFIDVGQISGDRLFLSQGSEPTKTNKGPRVFLSLQ